MTKDKIVRAKRMEDPSADFEADIEAAVAAGAELGQQGEQIGAKTSEILGIPYKPRKARRPIVIASYNGDSIEEAQAKSDAYHGIKPPRKRTPPAQRVARAERIGSKLAYVNKRKAELHNAYVAAGGFDGLADRAMIVDGRGTVDTREYTGGATTYYEAEILHPHKARKPYTAECLDIIEALGMSFAEGEAFKALWRMCAARQGKSKRGYNDAKYDAEKAQFYAGRILDDVVTPKGRKV